MVFATGALLTVACGLLVFAAVNDLAARTVPNWSSLALFTVGSAVRLIQGEWVMGLVVGGAVFLISAMCWFRGWIGGGDVKLLAATSLVVAPPRVFDMMLAVALAGGLLAIVYLALQRLVPSPRSLHPTGRFGRILRAECHRIIRRGPIPYASAIAAGAIFVLLNG